MHLKFDQFIQIYTREAIDKNVWKLKACLGEGTL